MKLPKEPLINTFLPFFKMSSKAQTRTFLKKAKRTLRFNQRFPKKISRTAVIIYCIFLLGFFIYGFITIDVNCYNSMNSDKMVVFEADSEGITVMNHRFLF